MKRCWTREKIGPVVNALVALLPDEGLELIAESRRLDWSAQAWEFLCAQDSFAASLPGAEWGDLDVKRKAGTLNKIRRALPEPVQRACEIARALPRRHYAAPTELDVEHERKCERLLTERFADWRAKGYLPNAANGA